MRGAFVNRSEKHPGMPHIKTFCKIAYIFLDFRLLMAYDNQAPVWAQSAMMREIAVKTGNFRGVCPSWNRAAERSFAHSVYRCA